MQQHQKAVPTPSQNRLPETAKTAKTAPVVLDEKALRQVAGGITESPKGGW
ncbi:MAG TPA: hypothetical protein VF319_01150 [Caldimonas sp.]